MQERSVVTSSTDFHPHDDDHDHSDTDGSATTGAPSGVYTNDQIAFYLTNTYWTDGGYSPHKFDTGPNNQITVNLTALTSAGQFLAREALQAWSDATGIEFVEVSSGGQITFDDNQSGAYASTSWNGAGFTISAHINISTAWLSTYGTSLSSYSYQTYIHEIGHALGLGHSGPYNGSASYSSDALYLNDSWQATVMSYFDQIENTHINASYARVVTPQIADIIAVQNLYGSNSTVRSGDTTYGFNNNSGRAVYDSAYFASNSLTIFDTGGIDTIDLSGFSANQTINLAAESISDVGGKIGNMMIARGTVVENAIGGTGNDTINGNDANNVLIGGEGADVLSGSNGRDWLFGGPGGDNLTGGTENDFFVFDGSQNNSGDTITDYSAGEFVYFGNTSSTPLFSIDGSDVIVNGVRLSGAATSDITVIYQSVSEWLFSSNSSAIQKTLASANGPVAGPYSQITYDANGDSTWLTIDRNYDTDGAYDSADVTYDDGSVRKIDYDQTSSYIWSQIDRYYDTNGAYDHATVTFDNGSVRKIDYDQTSSYIWSQIDRYHDTNGAYDHATVTFDNGSVRTTDYDQTNSSTWSQIDRYYDTNGAADSTEVTYDNGSERTIDYDQTNSSTWSQIDRYYDTNGAYDHATVTYDDGSVRKIDYDQTSSYIWSQIDRYYDTNGAYDHATVTYDDGSWRTVDYDQNDLYAWDQHIVEYDSSGNITNDYYV